MRHFLAAAALGTCAAIPAHAVSVEYDLTYSFRYTVSPPGPVHPDQLADGFPVFDYGRTYRDTINLKFSWDSERGNGDLTSLDCSFQPYDLCTKFSYGWTRAFDTKRGTIDFDLTNAGAWHWAGLNFQRGKGASSVWFSFDPEMWGSEYCFPWGYEDGSPCADPTFVLNVKNWKVAGLPRGDGQIYPAPLPAALPLLGGSLAGLAIWGQRRRRRSAT